VIWGAAPGRESAGEPSPEQKIASLEHYVADKGLLDRDGAPPFIDLRASIAGARNAAGATPKKR